MTVTLAPKTEARLQILAARRGEDWEVVIDHALDLLAQQDAVQEAEQTRLHQTLAGILADAQHAVFEPAPDHTEQTPEERAFGEAVADKFRRQGFSV